MLVTGSWRAREIRRMMRAMRDERRRDDADSRYEIAADARGYEYQSPDRFDRLAFAMRALELIRPDMTVVVYSRCEHMAIEQPLDPRRAGARCALVGIPPHASREQIAYALAALSGRPSALVVAAVARLR